VKGMFLSTIPVYLNGNNAAEGEDDIKYASSNLMTCSTLSAWNSEELISTRSHI